jgi:hypothetical protein
LGIAISTKTKPREYSNKTVCCRLLQQTVLDVGPSSKISHDHPGGKLLRFSSICTQANYISGTLHGHVLNEDEFGDLGINTARSRDLLPTQARVASRAWLRHHPQVVRILKVSHIYNQHAPCWQIEHACAAGTSTKHMMCALITALTVPTTKAKWRNSFLN